jgi:hypothetical protein
VTFEAATRERIASGAAAKARAEAIVAISDDLADAVKRETARSVAEHLRKAIDALAETRATIVAGSGRPTRLKFIKWIDALSNRLTVICAVNHAASVAVPKAKKERRA